MNGYREFVAIVDAGSVSQAARDLGMPRASLSRQLSALEARLGVRLLHRTTRKLTLTRSGENLYHRARRILDAVCEAEASVRQDSTPSGLLRISVPPMGNNEMQHLLLDFARSHPDITLEVTATSRHVDLVAEDIDVSIRAGTVEDPSLYARRLMTSEVTAVGSPTYLAEHGTPTTVADLAAHVCLRHTHHGHPVRSWPLRRGGTVPVSGPLACNDLNLLAAAALDGFGLALLPEVFCRDDVRAGRLVPVLTGEVGATSSVALVYAERKYQSPRVRAFIDHMVAAAKS